MIARSRSRVVAPAAFGMLAVVLASALAACAGGNATGAKGRAPAEVPSSSAAPVAVECPTGWQCRSVAVPVDWSDPQGATLQLAVAVLPARQRNDRIGPLFVNPGGPGAPAIPFAASFVSELPDDIRDRFDIVAFDPRGVGASAPIECNTDPDELFATTDYSPDTAAEEAEIERVANDFATRCANGPSRSLLAHVDTTSIARDMEAVRATLGDQQLSYFGFSWGTLLGAWYADLYPKAVRAMVLDGALDPVLSVDETIIQQAEGFDRELARFFEWCDRTSTCALRTGGSTKTGYDEVLVAAERAPLRAGTDTVSPARLDIAVGSLLYGGESSWPGLARALVAARDGDATALFNAYNEYIGRAPSGPSGEYEAFIALGCGDAPRVGDVAAYKALAQRAKARAPYFGESTVLGGLACAYWPVNGPNAPAPLRASGASPILVVGTEGDPATPVAWARSLASELASGVLVTWNGNGHTAYGASGCVSDAVRTYLLTVRVPTARECRDG